MTGRPEGPSRISGDIELQGSVTIQGGVSVAGGTVPGPGVDTTAVHRAAGAFVAPEQGNVWLASILRVERKVEARGGIANTADIEINGDVVVSKLALDIGTVVLTVLPQAAGPSLPPGDHVYTLTGVTAAGETAGYDLGTVTVPDPARQVQIAWLTGDGQEAFLDPASFNLYRDGDLLLDGWGVRPRYAPHILIDDGQTATDPTRHPPTTDTTGQVVAEGMMTARGHVVLESGAVATETITPTHTITVYAADGTALKIAGVLA